MHFGLLVFRATLSHDAAALLDYVRSGMAAFSCRNSDVSSFLQRTAEGYNRSDDARTYIYLDLNQADESLRIGGYFSLGLSSLHLGEDTPSNTLKRKLGGPHDGVIQDGRYGVYLLGQLGRNDTCRRVDLPGREMLAKCEETLGNSAAIVGGRMVIADCDKPLGENFYEKYGYKRVAYDSQRGLWRIAKRLRVDWRAVTPPL